MKGKLRKFYQYVYYLLRMAKWRYKVFFLERPKKALANPTDLRLSDHVNLFYWKMSDCEENLGDYLSKVVVTHFMPQNTQPKDSTDTVTLFATGSILGFRCQNATVWGSGILYSHPITLDRLRFSKLDIRAVRGPETRKLLLKVGKDCPEVYGDPAILMPLIFEPENVVKKHKISIVLHYAHGDFLLPADLDCNMIDIVTDDYKSFITQIAESSLVISSSLHGIILAETYGVPAIFLAPKKPRMFKYEDWYHSTGRYDIAVAHSIEEALTMQPMPLPDLHQMQQKLLQAFPQDIWN